MRNALNAGWACAPARAGSRALDAVEEAIVILEDDETFRCWGAVAFLIAKAKCKMDALLMDGSTLRAGGRRMR